VQPGHTQEAIVSDAGEQEGVRAVSPLELFFDLVFVLAIGQLTHHLVEHLTWPGAAETAVLLVGVVGVWVFTTFEVTLLDIERVGTRVVVVAVMGLGLFMNAGIAHAFDDGAWLFVIPMLLALFGTGAYAVATTSTPSLRRHFQHVLLWFAASGPLWIAGAALEGDARLWCWAAAAAIDLVGVWTAHPVPGDRVRTAQLTFDAEHMLERMRLFLIILLGETVLTLGRVISDHHSDALTLLLAAGGFVAVVCLWVIYFEGAEEEVLSHATETEDPIRSVHVGLNVIYGVVAGLVVLAAGSEYVVAHAHEHAAHVPGVLMLVGPAIYLLAQAIYFRVETGTQWASRTIGAGVLLTVSVAAYWLPPYGVMLSLVVILVALAYRLSRGSRHMILAS
jgi:low temperature requirement protein LtrA